MRPRALRLGIHALTAAALVACRDPAAPATREITIQVCDQQTTWVAFQNDGAPWQVLGVAPGTYSFQATDRLTIARTTHYPLNTGELHLDYLTADQAESRYTCAASASQLPGSLSGSTAGQYPHGWAFLVYGSLAVYVQSSQAGFQIPVQPTPADLVVGRYDSIATALSADRVIIRRDQAYAAGSTIPVLDFASGEAFDPQVNAVSFTASYANVATSYWNAGRELPLGTTGVGMQGAPSAQHSAPFRSIPASRQRAGDMHILTIYAESRQLQHYYRAAGDRTLTLGPVPPAPTRTAVATTPYRRDHVGIPSQPEYGASVSYQLTQTRDDQTTARLVIFATREHFGGTPAHWSFTVPDFRALDGWDTRAEMRDVPDYFWSLVVSDRRFGQSAANATESETVRSGLLSGLSP